MAATVIPGDRALLDSWNLHLSATKAKRTVPLYLDALERFSRWLAENGRPGLHEAARSDVEGWIGAQREQGLSPHTIRSRWIAVRSFYRWAVEEDEIDESPAAKVRLPQPDTPPPAVLSDDELRALLRACQGRDFKARRDYAIVRLMAGTGMRLAEVADIDERDIDLHARTLDVKGKGSRFRRVRIDAETAAAIDRYRRARARHRLAQLDAFWIGHRGRFGRKGIGSMLSTRGNEAGIGHVHPHQLRHTFADRWLSRGGRDDDLQRLGGWENASVMARYGEHRAVERALEAADDVNVLGDVL